MKQKYGFTLFENIGEFATWLKKQPRYGYTGLQGHHMASPSYKQWKEDPLVRQYNIKMFHMKEKGWGDIAQHFSTFPDGSIVTGRSLAKTEAIGIRGWNTRKICIENYGNFDKGQDIMTTAQRNTIVAVYALLCIHEGITPSSNTIRYHCWFTAGGTYLGDYYPSKSAKTCPGTNFFGGNTKAKMEANFLPLVKNYIKNGTVPVSTTTDTTVSDSDIKDGDVDKKAKVTCDTLNVRKARPDSSGNLATILDTLKKGDEVTIGYVHNGWASVFYEKNGIRLNGFVSVKYLQIIENITKNETVDKVLKDGAYSCEAVVATDGTNLNVRKARPDSDGNLAAVVDSIKDGTGVTLGSIYQGWGSIFYGVGKHGFVNAKYLKLVK